MVRNKPTFISLFAGCGGSSLGYKWAGFHELLAIDFDKNAVETFKLNFPDTPCWERDLRTVIGKEIMDFCHIKEGELDLLDASPPCQGFSTSGKRKVNDPRNDLFLEFVRLVKELKPKVFVMENVSGMVKGKMKGRFIEIMKTLKALPYKVRCKLMNAMFYGVPQSRQRLIWIGIRNDLNIEPSYPKPQSKIITVKEALKGVENKTFIDPGEKLRKLWFKMKWGGDGALGKKNNKRNFNTKKLHPNKPSFTLPKMIGTNMALIMHWREPRSLTIEEAKRIQSFPDDFIFIGDFREQWARIGNSVPPKFMEAIAREIKRQVFDRI